MAKRGTSKGPKADLKVVPKEEPKVEARGDLRDGADAGRIDAAVCLDFNNLHKQWQAHNIKQDGVDKERQTLVEVLKAQNFTVDEMKIADQLLGTSKQEQKITDHYRRIKRVAEMIGHPLAKQLELFVDGIDRTPSVDKAFDAGTAAAKRNERKAPQEYGYIAGTAQFDQFMAGFDKEVAEQVRTGIKPLEETAADHVSADDDDGDDDGVVTEADPIDDGRPKGSRPDPSRPISH